MAIRFGRASIGLALAGIALVLAAGVAIADIAPVRIGCDVWLGDKVTVVAGVTIGDNVIVGANSVVTRDIEPWTLVAGAPARAWRSRCWGAPGDAGSA